MSSWLVYCSVLLGVSSAFIPLIQSQRSLSATKTLFSSSSDDVDFMASLNSRLSQMKDRETKLPLVVLDSTLPRQVLKLRVQNPVFMNLVRARLEEETPYFGVLGMARLKTGEQVHLRDGVKVEIISTEVDNTDDSLSIQLKATERFRIEGEVNNAAEGWTEARVNFINDEAEDDETKMENADDRLSLARAIHEARKLEPLIKEWIELARQNERNPNQIDELLKDLGDRPSQYSPSDLSMWVGALVNPIPAMGVALEIRPALLTAKTAEQRVSVALEGIQRSIKHMDGSERLF